MGKKLAQPSKAATAATASSIDDIFAKPSASRPPVAQATPKAPPHPVASSSRPPDSENPSSGPLRRKKSKLKYEGERHPANASASRERPSAVIQARAVETVLDPSLTRIADEVRAAKGKGAGRGGEEGPGPLPGAEAFGAKSKKRRKEDEEDEVFRDSRGEGPRRKTEEGFLIYKEAELQIDPEAGGTPLCPFDCDCCF